MRRKLALERQCVNGATCVVTLATGLGNPQGIAVDSTYVYWTYANGPDGGTGGGMSEMPVGGVSATTLVPSSLASGKEDETDDVITPVSPQGVTVFSGEVVWTDPGSAGPTVWATANTGKRYRSLTPARTSRTARPGKYRAAPRRATCSGRFKQRPTCP